MLEVELNCLEDKNNRLIKEIEDLLIEDKKYLYTLKKNPEIQYCLDQIERIEEKHQTLKEGLHIIEQWKRKYCD
jgi:hypothetical protein